MESVSHTHARTRNTFRVEKLYGLNTTHIFIDFYQIYFKTVHHYVQRETDLYKSHDFFLMPIMIIL